MDVWKMLRAVCQDLQDLCPWRVLSFKETSSYLISVRCVMSRIQTHDFGIAPVAFTCSPFCPAPGSPFSPFRAPFRMPAGISPKVGQPVQDSPYKTKKQQLERKLGGEIKLQRHREIFHLARKHRLTFSPLAPSAPGSPCARITDTMCETQPVRLTHTV